MLQYEILQTLRGLYEEMRTMDIKPNFSAVARQYDIDRHTAAKYWKEEKVEDRIIERPSPLDQYFDEIKEKAENTTCTKMALYEYFKSKYGVESFGSYSTFAHYMQRKELLRKVEMKVHVRYETPPGNQLQADWKEDLKMILKSGEVIEFNLFVATLGYSRYHFFIYSRSKTTEDYLRCQIEVLQRCGGIPKTIVTDNMSAIVSIRSNSRNKYPVIKQFQKDIGIKIHLCKVRTPQTKGKVESANRFIQWLEPYNGELESEEELIQLISKVEHDVNNETNRTTGIPPVKLIKKEMEHLKPLPNRLLMEEYIRNVSVQTVPQTLLVSYKASGYSVPPKFIGKRVKIVPSGDKLYIYHNTELIALHEINVKKMNYQQEHYESALRQSMPVDMSNDEIHERAKENLALLDQWGGVEQE
mgnify:CR=1 FL=1